MKQLKNSTMLSMTGLSEMPVRKICCAFPCLPGGYEDDEPAIFRDVEVTLNK